MQTPKPNRSAESSASSAAETASAGASEVPRVPLPVLRLEAPAADDEREAVLKAEVTLAGKPLRLEVTTPAQTVSPRRLAEVFRGFNQHTVDIGQQWVAEQGKEVSCKKGCGACCRQLVQISPSEARALEALVASMPPERQRVIRDRFAQAVERLDQAGLLDPVRQLKPGPDGQPKDLSDQDWAQLTYRYFHQQIPCPFLEDEVCSIYEHRPLICRSYMVTSNPQWCEHDSEQEAQVVPLPWAAHRSLQQVDAKAEPGQIPWMPLTMALEWAEANPEPKPRMTGPELVEAFFGAEADVGRSRIALPVLELSAQTQSQSEPTATASAQVMVGNQPTALRITVPQGPTRPRQALPISRSFADHVVRISEQRANEQGKEISCKKGCGACCRQMVPISPSEAHALADLVESMPPERRERVKARFQQAVERLEPSGVFKPFRKQWPGRHRRPGKPAPAELDGDKLRQIGLNYTRQWVACPFLEEESCSIYEDRPLACREYSVTSPAELCSDPKPGVIQTLPLVAHPARAWWAVEAEQHAQAEQRPPRWLPLTLALEWAKTYSEAPAQSPGPALATSFFSKLSNRDDLDAAPAPGMGSSASEPTDRVSR